MYFEENALRDLVFLILTVALVSCVSAPTNFGTPSPSSRIGVVLLIDENPKHEHIDTTIFQNSEKSVTSGKNFRDELYEEISETFAVKNYELVRLEPDEGLYKNRLSLFYYATNNIHFKRSVRAFFDQVATENQLDFVIVVYPFSGPAWANSTAYIDGYGLYTSCRSGYCTAEALDQISSRIYDVKNGSSLMPMHHLFDERQKLPEVDPSKGVESITRDDIEMATAIVFKQFMREFKAMVRRSRFYY